ncbi:MAG TPA: glycosyltransferase family 39 protein, partial [Lacunisphaera sp.]
IWAGVIALLALHVGLALWAAAKETVTSDEIFHVTGGYFYNKYGDYRVQPENGNLPQRVAGLPAVLMGAPTPPLADNIYWKTSDGQVISHQLFYETGHDHWPMFMAGRALMMIFSIGTGLLVFGWARSLFGTAAGFLSLTLYALCPNILAHAPLTTSDLAAVFFFLASVGAYWRHLRAPSWGNTTLSGAVFGLACVAKYSAVLLLPMMLMLLAWRIWHDPPAERSRWWKLAPLSLAGHAALGLLIIWAFYGFRYSAFSPAVPPAAHFTTPWENALPYIGFQRYVVEFCRQWHLLPEAFLYGYTWVIQSAAARSAFLAGEYGVFGWVSFFPLAFVWKTPVAVLAAIVIGAGALVRRWRSVSFYALAPLLVLFGVYWLFSLTSHLNIGHRHILPIYPVLFIWLGALAAPGVLPGVAQIAVPFAVVLGQLVANVRAAPHYISFFNTLAGGPEHGYRLLVDSSLDWGQDLPALAEWLRDHNRGPDAQTVFLSYFGAGEPAYYGIKAEYLPFLNGFKIKHGWYPPPTAGIYCVSATILQQVYSPYKQVWTLAHEKSYQEGRAKEPLFREYWTNPATRAELARTGEAENFERTWKLYDQLRMARLCYYLRARTPDAMPGYSILVYRLSQADVDAALNGDAKQLAAAVERAATAHP